MRELEAELWCPACHTLYAQLFRVQRREGIWEHETEPASFPHVCTRCETIVERRPCR